MQADVPIKPDLMTELIRTLASAPRDKLAEFLRTHTPANGHCPACRTTWPCTLWTAGAAANLEQCPPSSAA